MILVNHHPIFLRRPRQKTLAIRVRGCLDCPFLWPPHCNVLRKVQRVADRVMEKRGAAPRKPPENCPLLESSVTVKLR
jgi:hypothetical protein